MNNTIIINDREIGFKVLAKALPNLEDSIRQELLDKLDFQQKFSLLQSELNRECPEREIAITALTALVLSGQHGLILGPPGNGKTYLLKLFSKALGLKLFETQFSPSTRPEQYLGIYDPSKMLKGEYTRNTEHRLPQSQLGLIDEAFKASPEALQDLLCLMAEKGFYNPKFQRVPLISVLLCSNEITDDSSAAALLDRITYKLNLGYLEQESNWLGLLKQADDSSKGDVIKGKIYISLSNQDFAYARMAAKKIEISAWFPVFYKIRQALADKKIAVSDRKWIWICELLKAVAWLKGESQVSSKTILDFLPNCLWNEESEILTVVAIVHEHATSLADCAAFVANINKEIGNCTKEVASLSSHAAIEQACQTWLSKLNNYSLTLLDYSQKFDASKSSTPKEIEANRSIKWTLETIEGIEKYLRELAKHSIVIAESKTLIENSNLAGSNADSCDQMIAKIRASGLNRAIQAPLINSLTTAKTTIQSRKHDAELASLPT